MSTSVLSRLPSSLGRQDEAPNQALAQVAAANPQYSADLFPVLLRHLRPAAPRMCRSMPRRHCRRLMRRTGGLS